MAIPTEFFTKLTYSQKDTLKVVYLPIRKGVISSRERKEPIFYDNNGEIITREAYNLNKSLERTKRTILEIALCNEWQYFITLTFDIKKYDSSNLDNAKSMIQYFERYLREKNCKFIVIPEFHNDKKKIHFHGLISGELPIKDSGCVKLPNIKKPLKLETCQKRHYDLTSAKRIYNLPSWTYGFASVIKIGESALDNVKISQYLTKYVTKDLITDFNRHRYYCSKSLKRNKLINKEIVMIHDVESMVQKNFGKLISEYKSRYCVVQLYEKPNDIDFCYDAKKGVAKISETPPL